MTTRIAIHLSAMIDRELMAQLRHSLPAPWLVVTDLDGTLLDHHTYSHEPVDQLLQELEHCGVPVILNTSKTLAELLELRHQLANRHPFIVENGSAIYLPSNDFPAPIEDAEEHDGFQCIVLGSRAEDIQAWLNTTGRQLPGDFIGFADMTTDQLMQATGLDKHGAALASRRGYSEAIRFLGTDRERNQFCRAAQAAGFQVLRGGRFLHLLGQTDKGTAMQRLRREYQRQWSRACSIIAAGDSHNDTAMLEAADLAIAIRSPVHAFPPLSANTRVLHSTRHGPQGWAEVVQALLDYYPQHAISGATSD